MEIFHRNELPNLLKHYNLPMIGTEVGCAEGYFSEELLRFGIEKLYMVDAWTQLAQTGDANSPQEWHNANYDAAMKRVAPYGDKAVVLRGLTTEMAKQIPDNSLGLVYLDAGHSYENVVQDLNAFFPKLVKGGILSGHDYFSEVYGVKKAVTEFCAGKYEIHEIIESEEHKEYGSFWFKID